MYKVDEHLELLQTRNQKLLLEFTSFVVVFGPVVLFHFTCVQFDFIVFICIGCVYEPYSKNKNLAFPFPPRLKKSTLRDL